MPSGHIQLSCFLKRHTLAPTMTSVKAVSATCEAPDGRAIRLTWGTAELQRGGTAEDLLAAADVALLERKTEKLR